MRVAAIVEVPITNGGGFNQSMNTVLQLRRILSTEHQLVVFSTIKRDLSIIENLGVEARLLPSGWRDILAFRLQTGALLRKVRNKIGVESTVERTLSRAGIDLALFVGHSARPVVLERIPYMATVWDLCHLDHPEFPEVGSASEFLHREFLFANTLPRAVAVMCASASLGEKLSAHYGVDAGRLVVTPFGASPFLNAEASTPRRTVLQKYGLREGYYFYPAQFWPHKNHVRILQAMAIAKSQGQGRRAVFCGGDHGNLSHVRAEMERLGLSGDVSILGFVPPEDVRGLYENAFALVMPSYFGPTNIPPIEAWTCGVPVVCSRDMAEQVQQAALVIDPDSADDLRNALGRVEDVSVREGLVRSGGERLRALEQERLVSEAEISRNVESFARRLGCWKAQSSTGGSK